jgi:hypothetical protein
MVFFEVLWAVGVAAGVVSRRVFMVVLPSWLAGAGEFGCQDRGPVRWMLVRLTGEPWGNDVGCPRCCEGSMEAMLGVPGEVR